jgi:hypothetical protein
MDDTCTHTSLPGWRYPPDDGTGGADELDGSGADVLQPGGSP